MFILDGLWLNSSSRTNNNTASVLLITFVLYTILTIVHSQQQQQQQQRQTNIDDDDNLYILIDEISVYTCRGGIYIFWVVIADSKEDMNFIMDFCLYHIAFDPFQSNGLNDGEFSA